jgi:hypothetical protein
MSEQARTAPVRFKVLDLNCRWCGVRIEVVLSDDLSPAEALAACERQADALHPECPKKPATSLAPVAALKPPYFEAGFDDQADDHPEPEKDPYT